MANNVGEWSPTAASNTSLGAVSLQENIMLVNAVNNAFRELMAQVATGISANAFLAAYTPASASAAASLQFLEDTDNGAHKVTLSAPASLSGDIAVELPSSAGTLYASGGTDVALADGGTGASLADPGADRIMFWDDSAGAVTWLTAGTGLSITDTTITSSAVGITLGTPVASTSGTSIDFTGIPSSVKRITISFVGVSTNGSSNPLIQLGDSDGIETSGYLGSNACAFNGAATVAASSTAGFLVVGVIADGSILHGSFTLTLENSSTNTWAAAGVVSPSQTAASCSGSGSKSLSGTLDRVRITTVNGTDAFDAGAINIAYE